MSNNIKFLSEATRHDLLTKAHAADSYTNRKKNRYNNRTSVAVSYTTENMSDIDVNLLFKNDIIDAKFFIKGLKDTHCIEIVFKGFCNELHQIINPNERISLIQIEKALKIAFNKSDIYVDCDCGDFKYRMAYNATKDGYKAGNPQTEPIKKSISSRRNSTSNINKNLGPICKHLANALQNLDWLRPLSRTIYNLIEASERKNDKVWKNIIYPAVYGVDYTEIDTTDQDVELNPHEINARKKVSGRFKKWSDLKKDQEVKEE